MAKELGQYTVEELVEEAIAEDEREGSRFDEEGWSNYFCEEWKHNPDTVKEAWVEYASRRL